MKAISYETTMARVLLAPYDSNVYMDTCETGNIPNNQRRSHTGNDNNAAPNSLQNSDFVKIFPNPNNGNMHISYHLDKDARLCLYNFVGQKIDTYNLSKNKDEITLSESLLPQGLYFIKITVNGIVKYTKKIVIIK